MAETDKPNELTARIVVQPSQVMPGIPPFVFSLPDGWVIDEAPGALAVIRQPKEVDGFWVNAIVSHDRVARAVDFKKAAEVTWAKLQRQTPDLKETFERLARFGSNIVYLRGCEMTSPESKRPLAQLHALFFAPAKDGGKVIDFFQIVCTSPRELVDDYGKDFLEVIASASSDRVPPVGAICAKRHGRARCSRPRSRISRRTTSTEDAPERRCARGTAALA
jgi:hypothetical protein